MKLSSLSVVGIFGALISGAGWAFPVATLADVKLRGSSLAVGESIGCHFFSNTNWNGAQGSANGACFGPHSATESWLPQVKIITPVEIVAPGSEEFCALDAEGVKCWSRNHPALVAVPPFAAPYLLAADSGIACAVHQEGLTCWSEEYRMEFGAQRQQGATYVYDHSLPVGTRAKYLILSAHNLIVALDNGSYLVEGQDKAKIEGFLGNTPYSEKQLQLAALGVCKRDTQWECLSLGRAFEYEPKATLFSLGAKISCWVTAGSVLCSGEESPFRELNSIPQMPNLRTVAAGDDSICVEGQAPILRCSGALEGYVNNGTPEQSNMLATKFAVAASLSPGTKIARPVTPVAKPKPLAVPSGTVLPPSPPIKGTPSGFEDL